MRAVGAVPGAGLEEPARPPRRGRTCHLGRGSLRRQPVRVPQGEWSPEDQNPTGEPAGCRAAPLWSPARSCRSCLIQNGPTAEASAAARRTGAAPGGTRLVRPRRDRLVPALGRPVAAGTEVEPPTLPVANHDAHATTRPRDPRRSAQSATTGRRRTGRPPPMDAEPPPGQVVEHHRPRPRSDAADAGSRSGHRPGRRGSGHLLRATRRAPVPARWLPFGTVVRVTNPANGESVSCVVDDREADTARCHRPGHRHLRRDRPALPGGHRRRAELVSAASPGSRPATVPCAAGKVTH